jgi:uncharacterized protein (TIGR00251 family)
MRTVSVKVVPNAKKSEITEENGVLRARLKAKTRGGKANSELIKLFAGHFHVKSSEIRIIRGQKSRNKTIHIG